MARTTAIVDYGLCNLDSIARATEECGGMPQIVSHAGELVGFDRIVVPGVGAFGEAMANLERAGLADELRQAAEAGTPILGICLGMQLLAERSAEADATPGLGLIAGSVETLVAGPGERVPHIGWNEVHANRAAPLIEGLPAAADVYFVHSYHLVCDRDEDVVATTPYAGGFTSIVQSGNVMGVQFHPEKSQRLGFVILSNFLGDRPC